MNSLDALFNFYLNHAGLLLASIAACALVAEKVRRKTQDRDLEWASTVTSLASAGAFLAAKTIVGKVFWLGIGLWVFNEHRMFELDHTDPLVWVGVFLVRDFVYYWVHRLEHTSRILWASHLVHHSPRTIGMATALRVPWMEALYKPMFGLWMPLLGFNPLLGIAFDAAAAALSQLQHTEALAARGRPTLLGWLFVTPSHHRVHHGYNPEYIDKNFGAVLIIWDRLFGTFEPEVAPVMYGVGRGDAVETVSDALVGGYGRLLHDMRSAQHLDHAMDIALARPGAKVEAPSQAATPGERSRHERAAA